MEPSLTGNPATPKPSPSSPATLRPGLSSSSSPSTTTAPTSDRSKPKLTIPTPPPTPSSSSSTASPRSSPGLLSRSSSLSTPPVTPLRQLIRSPSQVGRSQLNAASTENPPNESTAAGAKAPQPPPMPEPVQPTLPVYCVYYSVSMTTKDMHHNM